jgi:DNA-binding transcriptional MerR regulator
MRLGELSVRSGVPRSTIKFYLREGLLPGGEPRARNQATYGASHLERLALIRALREVAGLPLDVIARVTAELERGWEEGADPIGAALSEIYAPPPRERDAKDRAELGNLRAEVRAVLRALPWSTKPDRQSYADEIADALLEVRRFLFPDYPVGALEPLARVAWLLSEVEFGGSPGGARVPLRARGDDVAAPTRRAILGTLLFDRIFGALRRHSNAMRSIRISEGRDVPASDYVRRRDGRRTGAAAPAEKARPPRRGKTRRSRSTGR